MPSKKNASYRNMIFKIDEKEFERLVRYAQEENRSLASAVRFIIKKYLDKWEKEEK